MAKLELKLEGDVAIITMDEDDNRLNLGMCASLMEMLDKIEKETGAVTLVVASGHDRIWCNGFDTDWISACKAENNLEPVKQFLSRNLELRKRLLAYPLITIAAINGHVFGGGAVFSMCFDFRIMRLDRGFFCIPAIDRDFPMLPGTGALLQSGMPMYMVEDAVLTGRRFTGAECVANHVVVNAYNNDELMEKVMAFARGLNKGRRIVSEMKKVINGRVLKLMEEDLKCIERGELRV
ncbi:MAG: enoyl-CoA hydratase/isomerase family protein [Chloroflexi bacterium]|nr:enoyl-CoA hydratase/isomerase family protein [Chloroflexota bacterium]